MESKGEIVIYKAGDGKTRLEIKLEKETLWLSQSQLADLFKTDRTSILKHINNIYKSKELDPGSTCAKFAHVQKEGKRKVNREILHYNLDAIISVGYRVSSKRGTQFRIWASQTLKNHLVKGYTINEKRLQEQQENWKELEKTIDILKTTISNKQLSNKETQGLLEIISQYAKSFKLLNQFDNHSLKAKTSAKKLIYEINYKEAQMSIEQLKKDLIEKKETSNLFGRQKDESFKSILQSIVQTFDGKYLYPTIEEQAAHLLYFVIKSHPFTDGNKRIGAFLFILFLQRNKHLLRKNGEQKINDNALVALALLVAQSDPANKDLMIKLVINLINE